MSRTATLLRIYTDESAYLGDRPVRQVVVDRAKAAHVAGLTVFEAITGIGHSAHVHKRHFLERDRPLVIDIVDSDERVRAFAESVSDLPHLGMMTLQPIEILAVPGAVLEVD